MKKNPSINYLMRINLLALIFISALFSCNEDISVGSSLLEDGAIEIDYTDSIRLEGQTIEADPVVVYRSAISFTGSTYLLGNVDDPVFGRSSAEVYFSVGLFNNQFPAFDTLQIDSVVMNLPLDTLGQFAKDGALHNISVYQLTSSLTESVPDTLFSNQSFDAESMAMGSISKAVSHRDSVEIYTPSLDTTLLFPPQIRVPLSPQYWNTVVRDTLIVRDGERFQQEVKGFLVRSESSESSLIGLDLGPGSTATIELYYSSLDGSTKSLYVFDLAAVRSNYFHHDLSGTPLESALNSGFSERWYLQEMQGPDIELDLSSVLDYSDKVINRAALQLFIEKETNPLISSVEEIEVLYEDAGGAKRIVFDNAFQNQNNLVIDVFDGRPREELIEGDSLLQVSFILTNHVNSILSSAVESKKIIIRSSNKASGAARNIFFGTDSEHPPKLKLVTSNP